MTRNAENPVKDWGARIIGAFIALVIVLAVALFLLPVIGLTVLSVLGVVIIILLTLAVTIPLIVLVNLVLNPPVRGSGKEATETRQVPAFDAIHQAGAMQLTVTVGGDQEVKVRGDDNLFQHIETSVADSTLHARTRRNLRPRCGIVIEVKAPALREMVLPGSGGVTATGIWGEGFHANIAGSGDMALSGQVDNVELKIAGSGDIHAADLKARSVKVNLAGSGNMTVYASETANINVAGSGNVDCYGHPSQVNKNIVGSGCLNMK